MLHIEEGRLRPRRSEDRVKRESLRSIREACLRFEQGVGRPIENLNEIQRSLDELYETEWKRRRQQG